MAMAQGDSPQIGMDGAMGFLFQSENAQRRIYGSG